MVEAAVWAIAPPACTHHVLTTNKKAPPIRKSIGGKIAEKTNLILNL